MCALLHTPLLQILNGQSLSCAHAWHTLLPLHRLEVQSVFAMHFLPSGHGPHSLPPQSTSVSAPFCLPSPQPTQMLSCGSHSLVKQSLSIVHICPAPHCSHAPPPQSTSVSL